jgi:hypothetical protein
MTEPRIVANRIRTPDGYVLQSYHRHDYKEYVDANGLEYMVDGGTEYLRRTIQDSAPFEELSVYNTDPHEVVREAFHWGTRGKDGRQPLTWKPLCALDTDHIEAILETQHHVPEHFRKIFETELQVRNLQDLAY